MLWLICGYDPRGGRSLEEKLSFYNELKGEWGMHSADYFVMCFGELNGHMCWRVDRFDLVHVGYVRSQRNFQ